MEQPTQEELLELFNQHFKLKTVKYVNQHKEIDYINNEDFTNDYIWQISKFDNFDYSERTTEQPDKECYIINRNDKYKKAIHPIKSGNDIKNFMLNEMKNHIDVDLMIEELRFKKKLNIFNQKFNIEEITIEEHYQDYPDITLNDLKEKDNEKFTENIKDYMYWKVDDSYYYITKNGKPIKEFNKLSELKDFINNDMENFL